MKKLIVQVEYELEVPDHAVLREPAADIGEMLFIHGRYLEPDLCWEVVDEISDDGSWIGTSIDGKLLDHMQDYVSSISRRNMRIEEEYD